MALIHVEGFDHKQASPGRPITVLSGGGFGAGRFGGSDYGHSYADLTPRFELPSAITGTIVVGVAVFLTGAGPLIAVVSSGGVRHLAVIYDGGSAFRIYRNDGTLLATSAALPGVATSTWHYLEMKTSIADSGGTVVLRVDGVEVINFTGDTRNGSTADVQIVATGRNVYGGIGPWDNAAYASYDDVYILDTTGSAPYNDFLGDVRVSTLIPNGNGAASQLVGSDGNSTDNYLLVDEVPSSATDYAGSATVGQRDLYATSNLPTATGQVLAVRPLVFAHKSDAGVANIKVVTRLAGGTERVEAAQPLSATANTFHVGDLRTVDPANAAWTIASVNAAEFGVEVG